jgi:hypothetical protein
MQTVELDVAFGGQSQLLSKPMLLKGPYGGRPAAVQMMKKPHMTATVAQSRMEFLLMLCCHNRGAEFHFEFVRARGSQCLLRLDI